jgi:hypothetical protein
MEVGDLCIVEPIDDLQGCAVWCGDGVDSEDGVVVDVGVGEVGLVLEVVEMRSRVWEKEYEVWVLVYVAGVVGWVSVCDLGVV